MEHISEIIKLPERQQEESELTEATTMQSQSDLTKVIEAIRQGTSTKAAELMQLPLRYKGKALMKNHLSKRALEIIDCKESLFLTGKQGSGKTHLAISLMNHWYAGCFQLIDGKVVPTRRAPVFLPAIELMLEIKNSWHEQEDRQSEKDILDKYSACEFLVLDDLGAEKISEWSRTVLYLLIDRRYRNCKQTIITSNLTQGQLAEQLDARVASRICEMGIVLEMGDRDYRLKK